MRPNGVPFELQLFGTERCVAAMEDQCPEESFEWLVAFADVAPLFAQLQQQLASDCLVVVAGSGTSELSCQLQQQGDYTRVVSIDCDAALVKQMQLRYKDQPALQYVRADLSLPCSAVVPDGAAGLVVDKCTLDCLLCSDGGAGMVCSVHRMLQKGGLYVVISFHELDFLQMFLGANFEWKRCDTIVLPTDRVVHAVVLQKPNTVIDPDQVAERQATAIASWYEQSPLLTKERRDQIRLAWVGPDDKQTRALSIAGAYDVLFADEEKREYLFEDFVDDLKECFVKPKGKADWCGHELTFEDAISFLETMQ